MPESLAVRKARLPTAITRVHEVLDAFASPDHERDIPHGRAPFPARDAQLVAKLPAWVHAHTTQSLSAPLRRKGFSRL